MDRPGGPARPGGRRRRAGPVVGADGARSLVRERADFTYEEHLPRTQAVLGLADLEDPHAAPPGWTAGVSVFITTR